MLSSICCVGVEWGLVGGLKRVWRKDRGRMRVRRL